MPLVTPAQNDYTVYVPPGGAAGDIQAAINAMPAAGGIIQLGAGTYSPTSVAFASGSRGIVIQGLGSITAGADAATIIAFSGTGSGSFITAPLTTGCGFRHLEIRYTNTAFTGTLLDLSNGTTADNNHFILDDVLLKGPSGSSQNAVLLNANQTVNPQFNRVQFTGGGVAVIGGRAVAVTGVSVANPSVITAPGHGYTTGDTVRFGSLTTTPQLGSGQNEYVITVTGADTFTVPINVTVVTVGTGFVNNIILDSENSNPVLFQSCWFGMQDVAPVKDAGETWEFNSCFFAPKSNGDGMMYTHTPGMTGNGLSFINCWSGDITSANNTTLITYAGYGLNVIGNRMNGRQTTQITAVKIDENNARGFHITGNVWGNMYTGLDFGSTTGHQDGVFLGNAFVAVIGGMTRVAGTIPNGIGFFDGFAGTVPSGYIFTGANATNMRLDGDALTQIYRASAGVIRMDSELRTKANIVAGSGEAFATQLYGTGAAGIVATGTNANEDIWVTPKGTGAVVLNWPGASSGAVATVGQTQHRTTISPTQLVANTDNWNPTNLALCREISVDISAAWNLTGIVAQPAGTEIVLSNKTAFVLTLVHNATSTAANQFWCPGATNFALRGTGSVLIRYNGTASRWQVVAG